MGTFDDAYRQGLKNYEEATRARKEITGVFNEMNSQVGKASDGLLRFSWGAERPTPVTEDPAAAAVFRNTIVASIGQFGQRKSVGVYSITSKGYPVTLEYAGLQGTYASRDALAQGLSEFLRHPDIAGVLRWLVENQKT